MREHIDDQPVYPDGTVGLPRVKLPAGTPLRVVTASDDLVARAESLADRVFTAAENGPERLTALAVLDLCAEFRRLRDER